MPDKELIAIILYGITAVGCLGYVASLLASTTSGEHHKPKVRQELSQLEKDIEHELDRMQHFGDMKSSKRYKTLNSMRQNLLAMDHQNQDFELEEVRYIYNVCSNYGVGPLKGRALHDEKDELEFY